MKFLDKTAKKIPQEDYAEIVRAVHGWQQSRPGQTFQTPSGGGSQFVKVRNDTGVALEFGSVLGICGVPNEPDTEAKLNLFKYDGNALVCGDMPETADAGKFMVTQEPCRIGGYCKAVISGPAKVKIDVISESHEFADVTDGDTILTSGDTGVPILWVAPGTGEQWGIVNIGGGSGGGAMLVTVAKDGGAIGPPTTWTYACTVAGGSTVYAAVTNRVLRSSTLTYDFAPDGTYAMLLLVAGVPYLFLNELPQEFTC